MDTSYVNSSFVADEQPAGDTESMNVCDNCNNHNNNNHNKDHINNTYRNTKDESRIIQHRKIRIDGDTAFLPQSRVNNDRVAIAWRNLTYQVGAGFRSLTQSSTITPTTRRIILRSLCGSCQIGSLTALMGPSGAGKTTLLNVLSGNIKSGITRESEIYLNSNLSQSTFSSSSSSSPIISYFIPQHVHESIVGRMNVGDIFRYAYRFKNGLTAQTNDEDECSQQDLIQKRISTVCAELMLPDDITTRTYDQCSGGEQKRIAIAQELMSNRAPDFLFIDEPTTGLDSAAALEVVSSLARLCGAFRCTVIASIHLPNQETLSRFDQLYVIAKGGAAIYCGAPPHISRYLERTISYKIAEHRQAPIESLLKIACDGLAAVTTDGVAYVAKLAQHTYTQEIRRLQDIERESVESLTLAPYGIPTARAPFSFGDLALKTARLSDIVFRGNLPYFAFSIAQYFVIFAFLASLYDRRMAVPNSCYAIDQENSTLTCARDFEDGRLVDENNTFHGYSLLLTGFLVMCTSAIFFSPIVKVFRSEYRNHWYSLGVFYWSSTIVSLLEVIIYSSLISTLAYFLTLQTAADNYTINWTRFGYYWLFMWLMCMYMQSIGQAIGVLLVDYVEVGIIVCQLIQLLMTVMNSFFVDIDKTGNAALIETSNVIALKYITRGLMYTFYGIDRCDWQREFSSVLLRYHVNQDEVGQYISRVAINIIVVRAFTFVFMFFKFNTFHDFAIIRTGRRLWNYFHKNNDEKMMSTIEKMSISLFQLDSSLDPAKTSSADEVPKTCARKIFLKNGRLCSYNSIEEDRSPLRPFAATECKLKMEADAEMTQGKIILAWRNLNLYGVSSYLETGVQGKKSAETAKPILRSLNGQLRFGTLNGLMGTSGAGKTSLLKVINGRCKTRLGDETQFFLSKYAKIETCFVTQEVDGHLMRGLTARQALWYACRLKNAGKSDTEIDCEKIVNEVLNALDIADCASTKVERCSGGERKRLALAMELTASRMPNLVCIDEPTSGLDSNSAETVVACLARLAVTHHLTIVASIHQPNTRTLSMFDQLYVLARGGICIYAGPPSEIDLRLACIEQSSIYPDADVESPPQRNNKRRFQRSKSRNYAIEQLIEHSCRDPSSPIVQQLATQHDQQILTEAENAALATDTKLIADGVQRNRPRFSLLSVYYLSLRYWAHICGFLWIHHVAFAIVTLSYAYQITLFFDASIALPSGCMSLEDDFNNTCNRSPEAILNEFLLKENYKYNWFMIIAFLFLLMVHSSLIFGSELRHFANEHRNGWYSSGAFYAMKVIYEMIPTPVLIAVYMSICDIYEAVIPGIYWNMVWIFTISAIGFHGMAHIFALLANGHITTLTIISISVFIVMCQISNFFLPISGLHYVYQFIANFSLSRFTFEASLLLQYGFGRCTSKQIQPILHLMSIDDGHYYRCIYMLVANVVLIRLIAIYLLTSKANPAQNRRRRAERIERYRQTALQSVTATKTGNAADSSLEGNRSIRTGFGVSNDPLRIKQIAFN